MERDDPLIWPGSENVRSCGKVRGEKAGGDGQGRTDLGKIAKREDREGIEDPQRRSDAQNNIEGLETEGRNRFFPSQFIVPT